MIVRTLALGLLSTTLFWGSAAKADDAVTVGNADNGDCYPFSCAASDGITLYQQIFKGSSFSGQGYITSFDQTLYTDFGYGPGLLNSANYEIGFSTLPTYPLFPAPIDNIGLDYARFGVYSLGGLSPSILSFSGTPFYFDPGLGNLVMTVLISALTDQGDPYSNFYNSDTFTNQTARCFGDVATCTPLGNAPVTTFQLVRSLPVPAPLPLFGLGAAFSFSRNYRQRIKALRRNP
jgi:hypothetical protein